MVAVPPGRQVWVHDAVDDRTRERASLRGPRDVRAALEEDPDRGGRRLRWGGASRDG